MANILVVRGSSAADPGRPIFGPVFKACHMAGFVAAIRAAAKANGAQFVDEDKAENASCFLRGRYA